MTVELTGPGNCAECGTELTMEATLAGDAGPLVMNIRTHAIEVPGLYVCTPCAGAVMVGEKESAVTFQRAADFLEKVFAPKVAAFIEHAVEGDPDPRELIMAVQRLNDIEEVHFIMAACAQFSKEEGGLDFIPECDGHHEHTHPRDVAPMN
jgi:hypothetical protein